MPAPPVESTGITSSVDADAEESVHGGVATTPTPRTMTTVTPIDFPCTTRPAEAFCGALGPQAGAAWPLAVALVARVSRQTTAATARFLDSTAGRYFGLCVHERLKAGTALQEAVLTTTYAWMAWKTDRFAGRLYGVPEGAPYLLALIARFADTKI